MREQIVKTCPNCGAEFSDKPGAQRLCCSFECSVQSRIRKRHERSMLELRPRIGERHGELVLTDVGEQDGRKLFIATCSCGKTMPVSRANIDNGKVTSCGHDRARNMLRGHLNAVARIPLFGELLSASDLGRIIGCNHKAAANLLDKLGGGDAETTLRSIAIGGREAYRSKAARAAQALAKSRRAARRVELG